jgi:hypothetical protein
MLSVSGKVKTSPCNLEKPAIGGHWNELNFVKCYEGNDISY